MKCDICGGVLREEDLSCQDCGARYIRICKDCGEALPQGAERCRVCGGRGLPGLDMTREEMAAAGMHCFMPYSHERVYDVYLGGNHDGGGYVFHNTVGYTGPALDRVVLPAAMEGRPIYGVWNEFFCLGDEFAPELYAETYKRMLPIREVVLSHGIREAFTYAFFGCCGLEVLELPLSIQRMYYDFYDLFTDDAESRRNGWVKSPVTIRYRGSKEQWEKVTVTSRLWEYVEQGKIIMEYLNLDE